MSALLSAVYSHQVSSSLFYVCRNDKSRLYCASVSLFFSTVCHLFMYLNCFSFSTFLYSLYCETVDNSNISSALQFLIYGLVTHTSLHKRSLSIPPWPFFQLLNCNCVWVFRGTVPPSLYLPIYNSLKCHTFNPLSDFYEIWYKMPWLQHCRSIYSWTFMFLNLWLWFNLYFWQ